MSLRAFFKVCTKEAILVQQKNSPPVQNLWFLGQGNWTPINCNILWKNKNTRKGKRKTMVRLTGVYPTLSKMAARKVYVRLLWKAVISDRVGVPTYTLHHCFAFTIPFKKDAPLKWVGPSNRNFEQVLPKWV